MVLICWQKVNYYPSGYGDEGLKPGIKHKAAGQVKDLPRRVRPSAASNMQPSKRTSILKTNASK